MRFLLTNIQFGISLAFVDTSGSPVISVLLEND